MADEVITKATDTQQTIGTMEGHRGITFSFRLEDGTGCRVTFDFYGNGAQFNGATYARLESAAIQAVIRSGKGEIKSFTHYMFA